MTVDIRLFQGHDALQRVVGLVGFSCFCISGLFQGNPQDPKTQGYERVAEMWFLNRDPGKTGCAPL